MRQRFTFIATTPGFGKVYIKGKARLIVYAACSFIRFRYYPDYKKDKYYERNKNGNIAFAI